MTSITPSAADVAKIKQSIADQGVVFTREDEDQRGAKADAAAVKRARVNQALAASRGKSADITAGSAADIGTVRVASLGTGVGGGHPDGSARSGKRPRSHRVDVT